MIQLLLYLRALICLLMAVFVWYVLTQTLGAFLPGSLVVVIPAWVGGFAGGATCVAFSRATGQAMALTCGVILSTAFLAVGWWSGTPVLTTDWSQYWPLWFMPFFYLGAFTLYRFTAR